MALHSILLAAFIVLIWLGIGGRGPLIIRVIPLIFYLSNKKNKVYQRREGSWGKMYFIMSHHNDGMQLLALCKCTISIISAFHLYIWTCLFLCVLFRSPAQRKASSLSPTHSTSAQTVLKLEENRHANSGRHVPIDLKCFPLHLSLPDNMAVLA